MLRRIGNGLLAVVTGLLLALSPAVTATAGGIFDIDRDDLLLSLLFLGRAERLDIEDLLDRREARFDRLDIRDLRDIGDLREIVDLREEIEELEERLDEERDRDRRDNRRD
jgi:hypothetical protein